MSLAFSSCTFFSLSPLSKCRANYIWCLQLSSWGYQAVWWHPWGHRLRAYPLQDLSAARGYQHPGSPTTEKDEVRVYGQWSKTLSSKYHWTLLQSRGHRTQASWTSHHKVSNPELGLCVQQPVRGHVCTTLKGWAAWLVLQNNSCSALSSLLKHRTGESSAWPSPLRSLCSQKG